jgi:hypothetical protein
MINNTTKTLIGDIEYLKSPEHYIKDREGNYSYKMKIRYSIRFFSYLTARISLLFRQIFHFIKTFGRWENNQTLWTRLVFHINDLTVKNVTLTKEEVDGLTNAYNALASRFAGKVTTYSLSKFDLNNSRETEKTDFKTKKIEFEVKIEALEKGKNKLENDLKERGRLYEESEERIKALENLNITHLNEITLVKEQYDRLKSKTAKEDLTLSFTGNQKIREKIGLTPDECGMVTYIKKLDPNSVIEDDQVIKFQKGKIEPDNDLSDEDKLRTVAQFKQIFKENYGRFLTDIVWYRYEFDKLKTVTMGDLKNALTAAAANVRKLDLEYLFMEMQRYDDDKGMLDLRCGDYLRTINEELFDNIRKRESFEDLKNEEIDFLCSAFRTFPYEGKFLDTLSMMYTDEKIQKLKNSTPSVPSTKALINDVDLLENLRYWDQLELKGDDNGHDLGIHQHRTAITEYMGKTLAYNDLQVGMVLKIPSKEGKPIYYVVEDRVDNKGVVSFLVVPLVKELVKDNENSREEAYLLFRGTASLEQVIRDIDFTGVGKKHFETYQDAILKMVERYAEKAQSPIDLNITGHSLGGCDSQRALVLILEAFINANLYSPLRGIKKVIVTTHNSPRPEEGLNKRLKKLVEILKKMCTREEDRREIHIDILHIRYFDKKNQPDLVHTFGGILGGADDDGTKVTVNGKKTSVVFKDCEFVQVGIIDIEIQEEYSFIKTVNLHVIRACNKALAKIKGIVWRVKRIYDKINNNKDLNKELAYLHSWNENEAGWKDKFTWYINGFKMIPMNIAHYGLHNFIRIL